MAKPIQIQNLFKVFGDSPARALELARQGHSKQEILERTRQTIGVFDATFDIKAGEIFVIMGLSGSGKSTLVRLLNRLIEPTSGQVIVDGHDIGTYGSAELRRLRRKDMSMVFQSFALLPHLTVEDNVAFGLELDGVDRATRLRQAHQALRQVGLEVWARSYPDELSGGMQQRVGLARALAADPSILLMDEAFSALDPIIRTEMQDELLRLQEEKRRTIVFISHDLDEAMRIGDRIAIMNDGYVVQVGTPEEILRRPANAYVRSFIRGVDAAAVFKAGDIARKTQVEISESPNRGCRRALERLQEHDREWAFVVTPHHRFLGMVSSDSLRAALRGQDGPVGLEKAFLADIEPVAADTLINDLYTRMVAHSYPLPVVDGQGRFLGAISRTTLLKFLDPTTDPHGDPLPEISEAASAPQATALAAPHDA
ncbi:glycine betaine/L-proline ABC transporter ATP-binding protein ProV [Castellaniella sp.]|uniref:glycine betaine/L-proline ABC transporter ATP-binding protein ProV n=1 Tax=Castellaniella sp. TaxID=1955812 RepID=UPI00356498BB